MSMIQPAQDIEQAVRQTLARRNAWRRDQLLMALRYDPVAIDRTVSRLIGRGEVETLRPLPPCAPRPYFYRLCRESDGRFQAQVAPRKPLPHARMADAFHMGLG